MEVPISQPLAFPVAAFNEAVELCRTGRYAEAEAGFRRILETHPDVPLLRSNLGIVLRGLGRSAEATDELLRAVQLKPDFYDAYNALGTVLLEQRRVHDAALVFERLFARKPDYPQLCLNLGNIRMFQDRPDEAAAFFRAVLIDDPSSGTALNNLGAALLSQGVPLEGARHYRRATHVVPDCAEWYKNLGTCLLMAGEFKEGTRAYEWRLEQAVWDKRSFPQPKWQGEPLEGRTLLVHAEQGLGDSFQYIRYMPVLKRMGARIVFECQKGMKRVLSSAAGVDEMVVRGEPLPPFDVYVSLMSLMHRLGTDAGNVPGGVPYLTAESALVEAWRRRMDDAEDGERAFRIAINWHGNETGKSIPLEHFEALSRIPGVRLYSMQKVIGLDQLERLRDRVPITAWTDELDCGPDKFIDTAAIMANADLVVTGDTSIVHLAGALGRPVFMPLKYFADWRWMQEREDSPWYPTMRIFRQHRKHDWAEVMERVTAATAEMAARHRAGGR